jgi:hypothetical protein
LVENLVYNVVLSLHHGSDGISLEDDVGIVAVFVGQDLPLFKKQRVGGLVSLAVNLID